MGETVFLPEGVNTMNMDPALQTVSAHFAAFQARDVAAAVAPFAANAKVLDDTATEHVGTEAITAFFKQLFELLPMDTTQVKRFEHKVEGNVVLLWWSADSKEASFEIHGMFLVADGKIVL